MRTFATEDSRPVSGGRRNRMVVAGMVSDIRKRAEALGRDPASITICTALTVITGKTDADAEAKPTDYRKHVSTEGALALLSGYLGVDFAKK